MATKPKSKTTVQRKKPVVRLKKIKPVKRSSTSLKQKMKRSFAKWTRSAEGRKAARDNKNPTLKRKRLQERIKTIQGWIAKLKLSKNPNKMKLIRNHNDRIFNLKAKIRALQGQVRVVSANKKL